MGLLTIVKEAIAQRPTKRGKDAKLSIEDQILVMLQYDREYTTFFSIGGMWEVHESTAHRTVKRIEDILVKSGFFALQVIKA